MTLNEGTLMSLLREAFPQALIEVYDLAGDNNHYKVRIGCKTFKGVSRMEQHRMVYKALKGKVGKELHALALETFDEESNL